MSDAPKNAVSARLSERTAKELAEVVYRPAMASFDDTALDALCTLNEAHAVMLVEQALIDRDVGRSLLIAIADIRADADILQARVIVL